MIEIAFGELRDRGSVVIADGYGDDNVLVTDDVDRLPRLRFNRHGSTTARVDGCRFVIPSSTRGAINIHTAESGARMTIGTGTRLMLDVRMWRASTLVIGDHTTINQARIVLDRSEVELGEDCMVSDDVLIQSADQHGLYDLTTDAFLNEGPRRTRIGNHVWLGRRSTVMPDVEIGAGSIVGLGTIVTRTVPPCSSVIGIPGRIVREDVTWTRYPGRANARETAFLEGVRATGGEGATR